MKHLTISAAKEFVRSRLDELAAVDADMASLVGDTRNIDYTVEKLLSEAVENIHLTAPAALVDGVTKGLELTRDEDGSGFTISLADEWDGEEDGEGMLRLLAFKADNSPIVITESVDEDSVIGKLQYNKYLRGTSASPVLVRLAGETGHKPTYKYYTDGDSINATLWYFPYQTAPAQEDQEDYYLVADRLCLNVLNRLVGMVLLTYNEGDKAEAFIALGKDGFE